MPLVTSGPASASALPMARTLSPTWRVAVTQVHGRQVVPAVDLDERQVERRSVPMTCAAMADVWPNSVTVTVEDPAHDVVVGENLPLGGEDHASPLLRSPHRRQRWPRGSAWCRSRRPPARPWPGSPARPPDANDALGGKNFSMTVCCVPRAVTDHEGAIRPPRAPPTATIRSHDPVEGAQAPLALGRPDGRCAVGSSSAGVPAGAQPACAGHDPGAPGRLCRPVRPWWRWAGRCAAAGAPRRPARRRTRARRVRWPVIGRDLVNASPRPAPMGPPATAESKRAKKLLTGLNLGPTKGVLPMDTEWMAKGQVPRPSGRRPFFERRARVQAAQRSAPTLPLRELP